MPLNIYIFFQINSNSEPNGQQKKVPPRAGFSLGEARVNVRLGIEDLEYIARNEVSTIRKVY